MAAATHCKSRRLEYNGGPRRFPVPDEKVSWKVDWPDYKPIDYTSEHILKGPIWADPVYR